MLVSTGPVFDELVRPIPKVLALGRVRFGNAEDKGNERLEKFPVDDDGEASDV